MGIFAYLDVYIIQIPKHIIKWVSHGFVSVASSAYYWWLIQMPGCPYNNDNYNNNHSNIKLSTV